jgi:serine/threonine-protein kinase
MAIATTDRLVQALLRSPLLNAAKREELRRLEPRFPDSRELALEIIRREWLTRYQLAEIARGKGDDLIVGPYVVLDRLGEGAMGQVFRARHQTMRRVVALKVLRKECVSNPRAVGRFLREIRASAQLSHPNIVHSFDADQADGRYFIAMEYIDGVDLARLVKQSGPLPVGQACEFIRQAALGLQHAHEQGLVHRDIKPANLIVGTAVASAEPADGRPGARQVKLLDLGLARFTDPDMGQSLLNLTQQGTVMGTPEYMAPEQARDSRLCDIRSDLYSLGCTFYFALTGRAPFHEGSVADKLMQHQSHDPEPVGAARRAALRSEGGTEAEAEVPDLVAEVVRTLLAKKPDDRFQTPAELAGVLGDILATLPGERALDETQSVADVTIAEQPAPKPPDEASPPPAPRTDEPAGTELVIRLNLPLKEWARSRTFWLWLGGAALAFALFGLLVLVALIFAIRAARPAAAGDAPVSHVLTAGLSAPRPVLYTAATAT